MLMCIPGPTSTQVWRAWSCLYSFAHTTFQSSDETQKVGEVYFIALMAHKRLKDLRHGQAKDQ